MPKEKTTRKAAKASKSDGGKKKKGMSSLCLNLSFAAAKTDLFVDPNMPKRGLSAYMFFANEQRDKVRDDNPGIKFGMSGLVQLSIPNH